MFSSDVYNEARPRRSFQTIKINAKKKQTIFLLNLLSIKLPAATITLLCHLNVSIQTKRKLKIRFFLFFYFSFFCTTQWRWRRWWLTIRINYHQHFFSPFVRFLFHANTTIHFFYCACISMFLVYLNKVVFFSLPFHLQCHTTLHLYNHKT